MVLPLHVRLYIACSTAPVRKFNASARGCAGVSEVAPRPRSVHAHSGWHRTCGGRRHHAGKSGLCHTELVQQSHASSCDWIIYRTAHDLFRTLWLACLQLTY